VVVPESILVASSAAPRPPSLLLIMEDMVLGLLRCACEAVLAVALGEFQLKPGSGPNRAGGAEIPVVSVAQTRGRHQSRSFSRVQDCEGSQFRGDGLLRGCPP